MQGRSAWVMHARGLMVNTTYKVAIQDVVGFLHSDCFHFSYSFLTTTDHRERS